MHCGYERVSQYLFTFLKKMGNSYFTLNILKCCLCIVFSCKYLRFIFILCTFFQFQLFFIFNFHIYKTNDETLVAQTAGYIIFNKPKQDTTADAG